MKRKSDKTKAAVYSYVNSLSWHRKTKYHVFMAFIIDIIRCSFLSVRWQLYYIWTTIWIKQWFLHWFISFVQKGLKGVCGKPIAELLIYFSWCEFCEGSSGKKRFFSVLWRWGVVLRAWDFSLMLKGRCVELMWPAVVLCTVIGVLVS